MQTVLIIVHIFVCIFMILVILLQPSKEGGFGGMGGTSSSVFGGRGSTSFLGKVTTVCAALFMVLSLTLAYLSSKSESVTDTAASRAAEAKASAARAAAKSAAAAAPSGDVGKAASGATGASGASGAPAATGASAATGATAPTATDSLKLTPPTLGAPAQGGTKPSALPFTITPSPKPAH